VSADTNTTPQDSQQSHENTIVEHNPASDPFASTSATSSLHPSSSSTPQSTSPHASPNSPSISLEDRHHQLQRTLSQLTSERDSLTTSIKSARRDSQKADSALRSEIDILKRASEKHAASEHRAKQKVLALQEAVKRAQIATKEVEELVLEVEAQLPSLGKKRDEKEAQYMKIKEEADLVRREREREAEDDRKRIEGLQNELFGLGNKLDRLKGRREKLEGGVMVDLEEQLREIEKEIGRVESDPYGFMSPASNDGDGIDASIHDGAGHVPNEQLYSTYLPPQKKRNQSVHLPGAIGRPSPSPIRRPSPPNSHQNMWIPPRPNHSTSTRPPIPPQAIPHRQPANHLPINSNTSSSSSPTTSPAQSSTLSSQAAPFEPSRGLSQALRASFPPGLTRPVRRPKQSPIAVNPKWGVASGPSGGYGFEGGR
jgi:hypothetical protein